MSFDFRDYMTNKNVEIHPQTGYRFWRYSLNNPIHLASWVSTMKWLPGQPVKASNPDNDEQGIYAYQNLSDLMFYLNGPERLIKDRWHIGKYDGIVIGMVSLWGIVWDHAKGFRAEFAQPISFIEAYSKTEDCALPILRNAFAL